MGKETTDLFQGVNRAYEVLSDPRLKSKYDMFGANGIGTSAASDEIKANRVYSGSSSTRRGMPADNFGDNFGSIHSNPADISSGGYMGKNMNPADVLDRRGRKITGDDLQMSMSIDFETAVFGGRETIWIDHLETCEYCAGEGVKASSETNCCEICGGAGFIVELAKTSFGSLHSQRTCHGCRGSGKKFEEHCEYCFGRGSVERSKQVDVTIPAGVEGYTRLRIRGEGNVGPKGGPAGDLFLFLKVEPHPIFRRDGATIHSNYTIDYIDAILGNKVHTPVVGGQQVSIELPEGTQHQETIRLRGHGARSLIGSPGTRGDHFVTVQLEIPDIYDDEEEDILLQLRDLEVKRKTEASTSFSNLDYEEVEDEEVEEDDLDDYVASFSAHFSAKMRGTSFSSTVPSDTIRINAFEKKYVSDDDFTSSFADMKTKEDEHETTELPTHEVNITSTANEKEKTSTSDPQTSTIPTDTRPKNPFFADTTHELDKLREMLHAPVKPSKKAKEAARKAREMEEANELVANELEKLRELLHRPIESTKATLTAARKKQEMEEANALVAHELEKLRELLYRPLESTKKKNKASSNESTNEMVAHELDKLRELLYRPIEISNKNSKPSKVENVETTNEMVAHELEKLTELLAAPIESTKKSTRPPTPKTTDVDINKSRVSHAERSHKPLETKDDEVSSQGDASSNNISLSDKEPLVPTVKAQGVAQGVRISAEMRLEPDDDTSEPAALQEFQAETIKARTNSVFHGTRPRGQAKDSRKESNTDLNDAERIGPLESMSAFGSIEEEATHLSDHSSDSLIAEVVEASTVASKDKATLKSANDPTSSPVSTDVDDERSYAWEEITADSWRRKDPSDPVIRTDGHKFEEMLFSIFKL